MIKYEWLYNGCVEEYFFLVGFFVILLLLGNCLFFVWMEKMFDVDCLVCVDDFIFELELECWFGYYFGMLELDGLCNVYLLGFKFVCEFVKLCFVLIGDVVYGIYLIVG